MNITKEPTSFNSTPSKNIYEFTDKAMAATKIIYGENIPIENRYLFELFFRDYLTTSILDGIVNYIDENENRYIEFSSHNNSPTDGLKYALIASGISADGILPSDHCYNIERLLLSNDIVNQSFEYKTDNKDLVTKINELYQWMSLDQNNLKADPNATELVEIFITANNIINSGGTLTNETKAKLNQIGENKNSNFAKNNLGPDSLAYQICRSCVDGELSKTYIDLASSKLLQIMAGIDLWINQEKRDGKEVYFDNQNEKQQISRYYLASQLIGPDMAEYVNKFAKSTNMVI